MSNLSIQIKFTQSQLRNAAMRSQGICPQAMAMKPGSRVEVNRKSRLKRGYAKHKNRILD